MTHIETIEVVHIAELLAVSPVDLRALSVALADAATAINANVRVLADD